MWRRRWVCGWVCGVVAFTLLASCSDADPSHPELQNLAIHRTAPDFSRLEPRDTLVFSATLGGDAVSPERLTWSTSDSRVLRPLSAGEMLAERVGTATVRAVAPSGSEASVELEILPARVASIRLVPDALDIVRTEVRKLHVTRLDRKGNSVSGGAVVYATGDPGVALVDEAGEVQGVAPGEARITAAVADVRSEIPVRVREIPPLELDTRGVRLRRAGDRVSVTGTVEGEPRAVEGLRLLEEERWLHDRAVVELPGGGEVRAVSPGWARVEASASLAQPDTFEVRVEPDGPTVFFIPVGRLDPGAPAELRGWRLHGGAVTAVSIGGRDAPILVRDSATLTVSVPVEEETSCQGGARRALEVTGAEVLPESHVVVERPDELSLAPGDGFTPEPGSCLKLPADPEARWALAVTDAGLWSAVDRHIPFYHRTEASAELTLFDRTTGQAAELRREERQDRRRRVKPDPVFDIPRREAAGLLGDDPWDRHWELGDTLRIDNGSDHPAEGLYRVLVILDDRYVLLFRESSPSVPARVIDAVSAAVDTVDATLVPLLDPLVSTAPGKTSGQYPVLVRWDPGDRHAGGITSSLGDMWIRVYDRLGESLQWLLLHEFAHAYQYQLASEAHEDGSRGVSRRQWNWEGMASFTANEVRRRVHGIPRNGNVTESTPGVYGVGSHRGLFSEAMSQGGDILLGYQTTAGLFRWLRRLWMEEAGASEEDAFRPIFVGGIMGWWGCNYEGDDCSNTGLAERLSVAVGREVDPSELILDWAISQAGDDREPSGRWRNELYHLVSGSEDHVTDQNPPVRWRPVVTVVPGRGDASFDISGGGVEWIEIGDLDVLGATLELPDDPRWRWRLLRVR